MNNKVSAEEAQVGDHIDYCSKVAPCREKEDRLVVAEAVDTVKGAVRNDGKQERADSPGVGGDMAYCAMVAVAGRAKRIRAKQLGAFRQFWTSEEF